jgi:hypothetical protein
MISINRNDPPNFMDDEDLDPLNELIQKIAGEVLYGDLMDEIVDKSQIILKKANIQDIIDVIYEKLYNDNNKTLNLIVGKNEDNSLGLILDVVE